MAEGFLQSFDKRLEVYSAGTYPSDEVNPYAIKVMAKKGIDISNNKTKDVALFLDISWDYVITVCDNAKNTCPNFQGKVKHKLHMGFNDPALASGNEDEIMRVFESVRDEIYKEFYNFYIGLNL